MKTVKELAYDLGVTQQTIYNHLKKVDKELKGNIFKKQSTTYINEEGIKQIKISMGLIQVPMVKQDFSIENIINDISSLVTENISANIDLKMGKLEQEIHELKEQNKLLIELVKEQQEKKGFLNWFRK